MHPKCEFSAIYSLLYATSGEMMSLPVSQYIWHPRKFGTPVPYILGYFAPPGIFGTPYELGIMVPPYQIS